MGVSRKGVVEVVPNVSEGFTIGEAMAKDIVYWGVASQK